MRVMDAVRRNGVSVGVDATLASVAEVMRSAGVGTVTVLDGDDLVGIVTDRDLVCRGLAHRLDPNARIDGVMSSPVVTIDGEADLRDTFKCFHEHAIRRLAVTDDGRFVGVVAVDDLLVDMASDLAELVRPLTAEVLFPQRDPAVPAVPAN